MVVCRFYEYLFFMMLKVFNHISKHLNLDTCLLKILKSCPFSLEDTEQHEILLKVF